MTLSHRPSLANYAQIFPIATSFPALSILTISLDKCQIKSFENIYILIKVKVDLHSIRFLFIFYVFLLCDPVHMSFFIHILVCPYLH